MRFYLVRHGLTNSNNLGIYAGRNSEPILKDSMPAIEELFGFFSQHRFGRIVCSPLCRTKMTALELAKLLGLSVEVDDKLVEMDFGDWTGKTGIEVAHAFPDTWSAWRNEPFSSRPDGGESLKDVQRRVISWMYSQDLDGPDILAVTHESVIKTVLCHFNEQGNGYYRRVQVGNCSVQEVRISSTKDVSISENVFFPSSRT